MGEERKGKKGKEEERKRKREIENKRTKQKGSPQERKEKGMIEKIKDKERREKGEEYSKGGQSQEESGCGAAVHSRPGRQRHFTFRSPSFPCAKMWLWAERGLEFIRAHKKRAHGGTGQRVRVCVCVCLYVCVDIFATQVFFNVGGEIGERIYRKRGEGEKWVQGAG